MADYLVVAGESTHTAACKIVDLSALLSETTRGDNEVVPYVEGRLELPPWLDEIEANLDLLINGFRSPAGTALVDYSDGLDDNLEHYRALFRDDTDAAGRVEIELHTGNRVLEGMMCCRRWLPVRTGPATATVVARVTVGAGRLTVPAP
jgi:hypothetical protein